MAYRWKEDKDSRSNLRRLARNQLEAAIENLAAPSVDLAEAIHEARLHLKKLRSLVRLVRPAAPDAFRSENAALRDVARGLSQQRDRQAVLDAFAKLLEHAARQWNETTQRLDALRELQSRFTESREHQAAGDDLAAVVQSVVEQLRAAIERTGDWSSEATDGRVIEAGLADSYRRGRKALRTALADPQADNLHEWRKQIKYHRYHVRLFQEAWPALLEKHYEELKRLSDLLGDDHDLVVLRQAAADLDVGKEEIDQLGESIERRRAELQAEAIPLGRLLFAEKPKRLARRIVAYRRASCEGEGRKA